MDGKELLYPMYYEKAEILDNGPLRFTVRMTMPKRTVKKTEVTEQRLITQDCGSHFARVEVTYDGLTKKMPIAVGITVHESAPKAYTLHKEEGFITYAEALDHPETMNGEHYIGVFIPDTEMIGKPKAFIKARKAQAKINPSFIPAPKYTKTEYRELKEPRSGAVGHALVTSTYHPGKPFVYYTGSAWSLYDVPTHAIWQEVLRHEASTLYNGLILVDY